MPRPPEVHLAIPTIHLDYISTAYAKAPDTLFLNQTPPKKITLGSTWLCFLPYTMDCKEGSIEHIRSINHQWIEFTIRWSKTSTADYLLVQRCYTVYTTPDTLHRYPTHELLNILESSNADSIPQSLAPTLPITDHTCYTIEVTFQSCPSVPNYPTTWTLLKTPIILAKGQEITLQEDHQKGAYIGAAKIIAIHVLESSWAELVLRLAPDAKHFNDSSTLRIIAPLTHLALPPNISYLQARYRTKLPEILATVNLPKPPPIALTTLRTSKNIL